MKPNVHSLKPRYRINSKIVCTIAALISPFASADLVSYYHFNEGNNNDATGSNDGDINNQSGYSTSTPDGSSHSLDLSGTGATQDYVRIGASSPNGPDFGISTTNSFTISMWVNYTFSSRGIVSIKYDLTSVGGDRSGVTLGIGGSGNPFLGLIHSSSGDDAANTSPTYHDISTDQIVPASTWNHLAATYDSEADLLQIYVNGVTATTYTDGNQVSALGIDGSSLTGGIGVVDFVDPGGSFTGFGAAGSAPTHSSSAGDFTRSFYDGLLDEVGIWNNALTSDQIAQLAGGTSPPDVIDTIAPLQITGLDFDFPASSVTLTWNSKPNHTYALESSLNLINWSVLDDEIESQGAVTSYIETTVPNPGDVSKLFFRIREVIPPE